MATVTSLGFNITAKWDGAGLRAAQTQLDALKKTLNSIDGQNLRITADVDDSAARAKLDALKSIATNQTIHIGVDVDDTALTRLRETLDAFGHTRYVAQADVNVQTAALDAARLELERFGATHVTATADVDVSTAGAHLHQLTTDLGDTNNGFTNFRNAANTASFASSAFSVAGLATVGVLAAIGPAASLAGAALMTGLGGAFIGLGALILSQNAQVKGAMVDLKNSVVSEMQQAAQGMKGPLLDGIAQLKTGLAGLEPAFAQAFTAAGPLIQPLVQSILNFTTSVMPGFNAALRSAGPVFAGMAQGMQALGGGLGDMFRGLAAGAQGFGQAWVVVGTQVGAILGTLGNAMGQMASVGATALNNVLIGVNGLLGGLLQAVMPLIAPLGLLTRAIGVDLGNALRLAGPGIGQLVAALVSALIPVLNILLPVLGQFIGALAASLVPVIQVLSPLLTMFATGLATILNFLRPILPVLVPLVAGLWLLNAALLANPAVLIAAGIVLLVGAIVELATHWTQVWNGIKDVANIVWTFLTTGWGRLILAFSPIGWLILLATNWSTVWNAIKLAATTVWDALRIAWSAFVNGLTIAWTAVSGALSAAWSAVWNAMAAAAQAIWSALTVAWQAFVTGLTTAWNAVSGALSAAWSAVWNAMAAAAQAIWSALTVAWQAFVNGLTAAWNAVSAALSAAWSAVWNAMAAAAQAIWAALTVAWNAFVNGLVTVWNAVASALSAAWSALWNALSAAATAVWNALSSAWQAFCNTMMSILNAFGQTIQNAWQGMWNIISAAANAVWNALKAAWQAFVNAMMSILNAFGQTIQNAWSGMWNIIKNAAQAVWNALETAWRAFTSAMMSILNAFGQTIQNAWSGMWNIIKNAAEAVWNALKSAWSGFTSAMMSILNSFGQAFQKAWSGMWNIVKGVAHDLWRAIGGIIDDGVNACIDVVNGIIKAWNAIVKAVGLKSLNINTVGHISLPGFATGGIVVPVAYADGGTVPGFHKGGLTFNATHNQRAGGSAFGDLRQGGALGGYQPGKDSVPAMLSPGEGVLVPEAVRGLGGPDWVHWANYNYSNGRGGKAGAQNPNAAQQFAKGGIAGILHAATGAVTGSDPFPGGPKNKGGGSLDLPPGDPNKPNPPAKKDQTGPGSNQNPGPAQKPEPAGKGFLDLISGVLSGSVEHPGAATGLILGFIGETVIKQGMKLLTNMADKALGGKFGNVGDVMNAGTDKIIDGLTDKLINEDNKAKAAYAAMAVSGSQSVQAWAPVVLQALAIAGAPSSWLGGMLALMQAESGGNPNIFNTTDSNAKAGHPSGGLMQVIGPTFAAYCQPGYCANLLDPMSNILASINYIQARYGHVPGSPYASGTPSATPGVHLVGENGPEMVMFGGGETVKNASDTASILGGTAASSSSSGTPTGIDQQKLAQDIEIWKKYLKQIQDSSSSAWSGVRSTANSDWSSMQAAASPFAAGLAKTFSDSGNSIVGAAKATWDNSRAIALTTWTDLKANSTAFTAGLQKDFSDTGTGIQTKWKADLVDTETATTKSWADQKTAATQFSTDLQKTYTDMGTAVGTTWKTTLTTATADTTKYWTDTKAQYTQGTADMQTGFIAPVTTMMTTDLPNAFNASVTAIGTGWENLKTTVREPVAAVVDVVFNQGIVAMWNAIAGTFDAPTLDTFTMPAYATGGQVQGAGTGTSDSITARLSHGEHVWTAAEVKGAGGHGNVAALRSAAMGGRPVKGAGAAAFATGGAVGSTGTVGAPQGGSSAPAAVPTGAEALTAAAGAALGSIKAISNPFIEAAGAAGKEAVAALMPNESPYKTMLNNMTDLMVGTVTSWISANDVAPVFSGGANVAAAQAWADSQVGKPYGLGGDFVNTIDCSQFQSGIARVILGETPAPWFTTFAFVGDTAPEGFVQGLEAPYMVGITNVGVGHMAGTINGKNYEATPPAVRSGPSARGYNDPMFTNQYGFAPSIAAAGGAVTDSNHLAIIDAALAAAGVPPPGTLAAWESGLNTLITRESNWDPNAINLTDSNAQAGIPSQGLAQVIPPTFAAYHVAGTSSNILDPIANVAAAIRYIVAVYGNISNVQQANPSLPPAGYHTGTRGAQSGWHRVGERGTEWVNFRGGEEVLPNGKLPPSNGGNGDINLSVPITVHGNMDDAVYRRVENELVPKLRMMLQQRRGK